MISTILCLKYQICQSNQFYSHICQGLNALLISFVLVLDSVIRCLTKLLLCLYLLVLVHMIRISNLFAATDQIISEHLSLSDFILALAIIFVLYGFASIYRVYSIHFYCIMNSHPHVSCGFQYCLGGGGGDGDGMIGFVSLYPRKQTVYPICIISKKEFIQYLSFAILNCCSTFSLSYVYSKMIHIFLLLFYYCWLYRRQTSIHPLMGYFDSCLRKYGSVRASLSYGVC